MVTVPDDFAIQIRIAQCRPEQARSAMMKRQHPVACMYRRRRAPFDTFHARIIVCCTVAQTNPDPVTRHFRDKVFRTFTLRRTDYGTDMMMRQLIVMKQLDRKSVV